MLARLCLQTSLLVKPSCLWHYFGTNDALPGAKPAPRLRRDRMRNCRSAAYGGLESG